MIEINNTNMTMTICLLLLSCLVLSCITLQRQKAQFKALRAMLEDTVKTRTALLENRNQKLQNYAYMNAHDVRGPLARIMGLVYLIEINALSHEEGYSKIKTCAHDLDRIIKQINSNLEMEDGIENKIPGIRRNFNAVDEVFV